MSEKTKNITSVIKDILLGVAIYLVLAVFIHPSVVSGTSMEPTFVQGNVVICEAYKSLEDYKRGDILVYKHGYKSVIKRIIALPGETVRVIDGEYVITDTAGNTFEYSNYTEGLKPIENKGIFDEISSVTLEDDEWFLAGDNRETSYDCRFYGPIKEDSIKYKVYKKIF